MPPPKNIGVYKYCAGQTGEMGASIQLKAHGPWNELHSWPLILTSCVLSDPILENI